LAADVDPVTAFTVIATELLKLVNTIIASQPPDVQKQLWEWYVKDIAWWRKALKIDKE
jgi:hypothetical protein